MFSNDAKRNCQIPGKFALGQSVFMLTQLQKPSKVTNELDNSGDH